MTRSVRIAPALALATLAVLGLSACGHNQFGPEPPPAGTPSATVKPTDPGPIKITVQNANDINKRPSVRVNTGSLPNQLQTTDLIPGTGREAKPTDTVTVQYVAVIARTGQEFDASWDKGQPATFALDNVVPGFRNGVAGMKEGGRRQILIPPDQGYGPEGFGSLIGPNEHLIFIVDLIKIDS
jgi:peptidylprolyl isomerase